MGKRVVQAKNRRIRLIIRLMGLWSCGQRAALSKRLVVTAKQCPSGAANPSAYTCFLVISLTATLPYALKYMMPRRNSVATL